MLRFCIPCIISLLVGALYNIVDQLFIANSPDLGSCGNAASTVVFPLTVVALAIAVVMGDGCCAYVSLLLGSGQNKNVSRCMGTAITLTLISSLLLMGIYLHFSQSLLLLFGGGVNEQTLEFSREYFFIIMLGIPFYMFSQAVNPMIRADGSPQFAMISTLAGALLNVILDPLFIFGFEMGMTGAALATILGQILSSALCLFYLRKPQLIVLSWKDLKPESKMTGKILEYGLTSFLSQISLVAAMAAINSMLLKYGALDPVYSQPALAQIPMAVVGIVMKIFQIVISIVVGMAAGCIPIVGFNMGAKKRPGQKTADPAPVLGSRCRLHRTAAGRAFPRTADWGLWYIRRESLLYGFCRPFFQDLSLHAAFSLYQQGILHLSAGHGKTKRIHSAFHGQGNRLRGWLCAAAAEVFRAGRHSVFHAGLGSSDRHSVHRGSGADHKTAEINRKRTARLFTGTVFFALLK